MWCFVVLHGGYMVIEQCADTRFNAIGHHHCSKPYSVSDADAKFRKKSAHLLNLPQETLAHIQSILIALTRNRGFSG